MYTINIMSGIAGSGKSTFINRQVFHTGAHHLHRDMVRAQLRKELNSTEYFPCTERQEYQYWTDRCAEFLRNGGEGDYWFDQTTLTNRAVCRFISTLMRKAPFLKNNAKYVVHVLHPSVEDCIARDSTRTGNEHVTEKVIREMAERFDVSIEGVIRCAPGWGEIVEVKHYDDKEGGYVNRI